MSSWLIGTYPRTCRTAVRACRICVRDSCDYISLWLIGTPPCAWRTAVRDSCNEWHVHVCVCVCVMRLYDSTSSWLLGCITGRACKWSNESRTHVVIWSQCYDIIQCHHIIQLRLQIIPWVTNFRHHNHPMRHELLLWYNPMLWYNPIIPPIADRVAQNLEIISEKLSI